MLNIKTINKMKTKSRKCRTLNDLRNHPLVREVDREYNPGIFDGYDYTYWLYLEDGYWFDADEIGLIHEATVADVLSYFNANIITKRTDGF
jgi:hypothetical protein